MLIYGVDFSGAADAGRKIWLARGSTDGNTLVIAHIIPACQLPGGGEAREAALAGLRDLVTGAGEAVFGLDFPFSLPRQRIPYPTWEAFAAAFAVDYPTADTLYTAGRAAPVPSRRATDLDARTPFSPQNLRLYRQTYYGIRDLLAPLAAAGSARVTPMQPPAPGVPTLLEICPASTLKREGLYRPYKGKREAERQQRGVILDALDGFGVRVDDTARTLALDDTEGDALDSIIAALGAWRAARDPAGLEARDDMERVEGRVYF
jgi:hypothetical protein